MIVHETNGYPVVKDWVANRQGALVLGLGNTLLGDDGVGVRVVEALRHVGETDDLEIVDGGTMGFRLSALIADANTCIIVDAADLKEQPGTVNTLTPNDIEGWFAGGTRSTVHEAGLLDLLGLLRLEERLPERLAIVVIQPQDIDWGEELSPVVAAAIPAAIAAILDIKRQWAVRGHG
ncbi:hydrogenase maturation protease [Aquicoccus sp. SU-CL01552]|uniref:hydrogenase maturation protease n=1 Tax=Aquicoccus sp. SU-CL01552 TaxID=3127656 RepID=UPI003109FA9C